MKRNVLPPGWGKFLFHGVIGWPLSKPTSHERAVVRLVSTAFALISIQLLYWILRFWLPPAPSAVALLGLMRRNSALDGLFRPHLARDKEKSWTLGYVRTEPPSHENGKIL